MAGKLVILARGAPPAGWSVMGAALDAAEAQALVARVLAANPSVRVVVAQAIRSFRSAAATAEDAVVAVDP